MTEPVKDRIKMIEAMRPSLMPGKYEFVTVANAADAVSLLPKAKATFQEEEGLSMILPATDDCDLAMRQITLQVNSALDGVGLTAAVSNALAARGIPCNVVAARNHDHLFVPEADAQTALDVLCDLARDAAKAD